MAEKTTQYYFRLSPDELKLVRKAAELDSRSVSNFIRVAVVDRAKKFINADKKRKV